MPGQSEIPEAVGPTEEDRELLSPLFKARIAGRHPCLLLEPASGRISRCNPAARVFYGDESPVDRSLYQAMPAASAEALRRDLMQAYDDGGGKVLFEQRRGDGSPRQLSALVVPVEHRVGPLLLAIVEDATAQEEEDRLRDLRGLVFETTVEGVWIADRNQRIIAVNRSFVRITGYPEEEVVGSSPGLFVMPGQSDRALKEMWTSIETRGWWEGQIWTRRQTGEQFPQWLSVTVARSQDGQPEWYVGMFSDDTARKQLRDELEFRAMHDTITNLPNQSWAQGRTHELIEQASRNNWSLAFVVLDLDRFRAINDFMGILEADELLAQVAHRLQRASGGRDVARLRGDEFLLLIEDAGTAQDCERILRPIVDHLRQPYPARGRQVYLSASCGVAMCPANGDDFQRLLQNADTALLRLRRSAPGHRGGIAFYDPSMDEQHQKRIKLENLLRHAIVNNQFELYYQPIVDLETGEIRKLEALVRWHHPESGMISPADFIPVAEEAGLIVALGEYVLSAAAKQAEEWEGSGLPCRVAVNLSAAHFDVPDATESILECIRLNGAEQLPAIELEITESTAMRDPALMGRVLKELDDAGVRVSLDDFGTGYSSLSYLTRFAISTIKIDRAFVMDLPHDEDMSAIVRAIYGLASGLGLDVVVEGVERIEQLAFLREQGFKLIQGFYFSRPMPSEEITALLRRSREATNYAERWPT